MSSLLGPGTVVHLSRGAEYLGHIVVNDSLKPDADSEKASLMDQNKIKDGLMFKLDFDPRIIGNKVLADGTLGISEEDVFPDNLYGTPCNSEEADTTPEKSDLEEVVSEPMPLILLRLAELTAFVL